eukprot:GHVS01004349.1.p1 GENE.GHVS01004349.1~~GHVS01004349.1.p1  ORF type:complete len:373 (+),score=23.21 GHVS01004349.1:142-1260(+)
MALSASHGGIVVVCLLALTASLCLAVEENKSEDLLNNVWGVKIECSQDILLDGQKQLVKVCPKKNGIKFKSFWENMKNAFFWFEFTGESERPTNAQVKCATDAFEIYEQARDEIVRKVRTICSVTVVTRSSAGGVYSMENVNKNLDKDFVKLFDDGAFQNTSTCSPSQPPPAAVEEIPSVAAAGGASVSYKTAVRSPQMKDEVLERGSPSTFPDMKTMHALNARPKVKQADTVERSRENMSINLYCLEIKAKNSENLLTEQDADFVRRKIRDIKDPRVRFLHFDVVFEDGVLTVHPRYKRPQLKEANERDGSVVTEDIVFNTMESVFGNLLGYAKYRLSVSIKYPNRSKADDNIGDVFFQSLPDLAFGLRRN